MTKTKCGNVQVILQKIDQKVIISDWIKGMEVKLTHIGVYIDIKINSIKAFLSVMMSLISNHFKNN